MLVFTNRKSPKSKAQPKSTLLFTQKVLHTKQSCSAFVIASLRQVSKLGANFFDQTGFLGSQLTFFDQTSTNSAFNKNVFGFTSRLETQARLST